MGEAGPPGHEASGTDPAAALWLAALAVSPTVNPDEIDRFRGQVSSGLDPAERNAAANAFLPSAPAGRAALTAIVAAAVECPPRPPRGALGAARRPGPGLGAGPRP